MAAYLLLKEGGEMNYMKLIKLMYFSDKERINRYSHPISYDVPYSMKYGPVLSETLNLIKGDQPSKPKGWNSRIAEADLVNKTVSVNEGVTLKHLGKLSKADREVMDYVWKKLGWMDKWQLVSYTHKHCPEWENPNGSEWKHEGKQSAPITIESLCESLDFDEEDIQGIKENLNEAQDIICFQNQRSL